MDSQKASAFAEADSWRDSGGKTEYEEPPSNKIMLTFSRDHCSTLLDSLFHYYTHGTFCDVNIICKDGSVKCHKLVLAALSDMMKEALQDVKDDFASVMMPDQDIDGLVQCLEAVYRCSPCKNGNLDPGYLGVTTEVLSGISANAVQEMLYLNSEQ